MRWFCLGAIVFGAGVLLGKRLADADQEITVKLDEELVLELSFDELAYKIASILDRKGQR